MKKLKFLGLAVLLLALLFAGCDGGDSGDSDTWNDITSSSQLSGTWMGSINDSGTFRQWYEAEGETWDSEVENAAGNISVKQSIELGWVINSGAGLFTETYKQTLTFSGGKINDIWADLKATYLEWGGSSINDSNHSVTWAGSHNESITETDFTDWVQISDNGKKLKFSIETAFGVYKDFTMTKQ